MDQGGERILEIFSTQVRPTCLQNRRKRMEKFIAGKQHVPVQQFRLCTCVCVYVYVCVYVCMCVCVLHGIITVLC